MALTPDPAPPFRRLLIRLDANHGIGLGHAVRVAALLEALTFPVHPVVIGRGEALPRLFPGAECHPLPEEEEGPDVESVWEQALSPPPDIILVDLPLRCPRPWIRLRGGGVPVVALDDEGGGLDADLVVNGTALDETHRYEGLPPGVRRLLGPDYVLIRPAFTRVRWRPGAPRRLFIVVGSGERAQEWALALAADGLRGLGLSGITLTVGLSFPDVSTLRRVAAPQGIEVCQGLGPDALAHHFASHPVCLMTGGMVVYEALATGAPVVAFPQVPNMVPEMQWFAARGSLTDLGFDGGMSLERVRAAVARLLDDPEAARRQSEAGLSLIDGQGTRRVAAALGALLNHRPAPPPNPSPAP